MTHIIKKGPIKVSTQPKDFDLQATGLVFKSYDNQIALEFNVTQQDGTPADLLGANLRLLMFIYDEVDGTIKKEPIPFITKNLITESFLNGHVVYILPEAMKAYNGMVEAYVYIEYPDGSTSDNLGFTFRMKRSAIDGLAQDKADYFIADFQQLLDGVKQEATDAVNEVLAKVEASSTAKMQELEAVLDAEAKRLTEHANQNNQKITEYDQKFQQTAQNIATLDQNLNELRNDLKLSEAWAWSADGTDRFTDKYPIDNLLPNSMFNSQMGWTATMLDAGSTQSGIANGEAWLEDLTATTYRWKQWQIYFDNNRYPDTFELIKANPNKRVTVSVDAKVEGNTIKYPGVVELSLRSSTGDNWVRLRVDDTKISSEYTRYTAIGTLPSDFNNVQNFRLILTFNGNGRATFTKPKLAIGNDGFYTPAPSEDYENAYPMYIGTYSDSNVKGSDNPTDYTWARSMGNEGPNGVGIASTIIEYNKSTSSTTKPTTGWTSGIPSISGGEYLWTRTTLNYTNSTKAESYTVSRQGQDGSDGQLFTGEFAPTNFNEGDLWYKVVSGKVTAVFKATSGQWIEVPFDSSVIAETIVGKTIQASHLTGSTIDGGKISGAEFLNEYENVTTGVNQVADGKLAIKNGILQAGSTYYLTNSAGERLYTFATTDADIHQGTVNLMQKVYDKTGKQTSQSTTGISGGLISLALSDASGNYHGVLDAKALTKTPWINIQMSSAFTVAENNPPQYRVTYNLDGTRRVAFRGQFKLVSGNMTTDRQYCPFQTGSGTEWNGTPTLPLDIAPPRAVFAALTVMPPSGPAIPGRMGMNTIAMMGFAPGTTTVHVNLSGFEYDID